MVKKKKTTKKRPTRAKRPDQSQVALSVVEKAIGGKLVAGPKRR
jgi:hypothetical protein